ncbi:uncharacterized protein [Chironomus tepperi]|uniref:uncharacterized protein n=1 Tax=Chironomus tepperi TaxID=113505 RepID=UPI00391F5F67
MNCKMKFLIFCGLFVLLLPTLAQNSEGTCGRVAVLQGYIYGGNFAKRGLFPWAAVLMDKDGIKFCGGTLLTNKFVLTAAHCIHGKEDQHKFTTNDITVVLGAHNFNVDEPGRVYSEISTIKIHEDWNVTSDSYDADIAMLTLKEHVTFSSYIQPICLIPPESNVVDILHGYVVGYGKNQNQNLENILKYVKMPIQLNNEDCFYTHHPILQLSSKRTFCAGDRNGSGVCIGDSGNGLFVNDQAVYYLRGIVSASIADPVGCNTYNYAIFTNVQKFYEWITNIIYQRSHVIIWASKKLFNKKDYNVILLPTNLYKRTEIALQYRRNVGTVNLKTDKVAKMRFPNQSFASKKEFELIMTLYRNETGSTGQRNMCMTQVLPNIEVDNKDFYAFIKTDKPIYKPGDTLWFRVVVVDRDLKPYAINNIKISIIDSFNREIKSYEHLGQDGVFKENFILSRNSALGMWKIRAVIDNCDALEKIKEFAVQKFNPLSVHLILADRNMLPTSVLKISFYAVNQWDYFVQGKAQLTIKCTTTGETVITKSFDIVTGIQHVNYKVKEDLKATAEFKLDYEVSLEFTEQESQIKSLKTSSFTVHHDTRLKIDANHPDKFMPGHPFNLDVFIYDWKDSLVKNSNEKVHIEYTTHFQNGIRQKDAYDVSIRNGIAQNSFIVPEDANELKFKIDYVDATYEKSVLKGAVEAGINRLVVDHVPKNPQYNDTVNVYVRAESGIDQIIAFVTSRHGYLENHQMDCNYRLSCKFNFTMKQDMMLESKVTVYYIQDNYNILKGVTTIRTEYDENFLIENALSIDDVSKELADYDEQQMIINFNMKKSNWHECTPAELKRIQRGRLNMRNTT